MRFLELSSILYDGIVRPKKLKVMMLWSIKASNLLSIVMSCISVFGRLIGASSETELCWEHLRNFQARQKLFIWLHGCYSFLVTVRSFALCTSIESHRWRQSWWWNSVSVHGCDQSQQWYQPLHLPQILWTCHARVHNNTSFPSERIKVCCRWASVSEHVSGPMAWTLLTDKTQKIIHRSAIQSALDPN